MILPWVRFFNVGAYSIDYSLTGANVYIYTRKNVHALQWVKMLFSVIQQLLEAEQEIEILGSLYTIIEKVNKNHFLVLDRETLFLPSFSTLA